MQCVQFKPNGTLQIINNNTDGSCPSGSYLLLEQADYSLMVQAYEVTPAQVAEVFGWGFGTVLFFWFFGYVIGVSKKVISKL